MFCENCGCEVSVRVKKLRRTEKRGEFLCNDCAHAKKVNTRYGLCFSHVGEFNDADEPINKFGYRILDGHRLCGMRDCINANHIIRAFEFEKFGLMRLRADGASWARIYQAIIAEGA